MTSRCEEPCAGFFVAYSTENKNARIIPGPNIFALGHGIAMLRSAWTEAEPPQAAEERNQKLKSDAAALAKATLGNRN